KLDALIKYSRKFERENGRLPRLWIDMFCIDQNPEEVEINVKCLPVFLMAAEKVLVINSPKFLSRMWCLTEIYTRWIMSTTDTPGEAIIEIVNVESSSSLD